MFATLCYKLILTFHLFLGFRRRPVFTILFRFRRFILLLQQPLSPIQQPRLPSTTRRKTVCRRSRWSIPTVHLCGISQQICVFRRPSFWSRNFCCCSSNRSKVRFCCTSLQRRRRRTIQIPVCCFAAASFVRSCTSTSRFPELCRWNSIAGGKLPTSVCCCTNAASSLYQ